MIQYTVVLLLFEKVFSFFFFDVPTYLRITYNTFYLYFSELGIYYTHREGCKFKFSTRSPAVFADNLLFEYYIYC